LVLNIFPSLDTSVCATSVRKFNQLASGLDNTLVVIDESGKVVYSEQVPEIVQEPDYDKAISAL
jgi:peroxiredoxin